MTTIFICSDSKFWTAFENSSGEVRYQRQRANLERRRAERDKENDGNGDTPSGSSRRKRKSRWDEIDSLQDKGFVAIHVRFSPHIKWDSKPEIFLRNCEINIEILVTSNLLAFITKMHTQHFVQGNHSACEEPPVDFKTKVLFLPGLA